MRIRGNTSGGGRTRALAAAALATLLPLGGCKSVTGRIWLPVYSEIEEEAVGRVYVHFTVDCATSLGRNGALVALQYVDTVENVRFDGEVLAPVCGTYDPLFGLYGQYVGAYYPSADWAGMGGYRAGSFVVDYVDGGEPGYSEDDYVCLTMEGGSFARYRLPARDDVDGDHREDEGCSFLGGGKVQINLGSTEPLF